jgi:hypothetical protein
MLRVADWSLWVELTGLYLPDPTTDSKSISQPYRCFAKPYTDSDPIEYLAERARSARQVSQSLSSNT